MPSPSDNNHSGRRITLPPIRDFFRDEFMHSRYPTREPPSTTVARLRMNDDGGTEAPSIRPLSPGHGRPPTRMYRSTSEQFVPRASHLPPFSQQHLASSTSHYQDYYQSAESPSAATPHSHPSTPRRRTNLLPSRRPSHHPTHHSQSHTSPQSLNQRQDWSMDVPNQRSYPSYNQSSHVEFREHPGPPNPAGSAQVYGLDSPPALVRAAAPWVIATNLDVGQIYEDDERTPIARPFDVGPMGRSTSHVVPLGRFFDEGSQPPLGKYDCKFCGKLFNRPSSLRIHLNSHTGEKPFVCPHPDCGRSFSVLSNMRRHARVHMSNPKEQEQEDSNDDMSSQPSSTAPSTPRLTSVTQEAAPMPNLTRSQTHSRDSNASPSSSRSRRRRDTSSDGDQMAGAVGPEKRNCQRPD